MRSAHWLLGPAILLGVLLGGTQSARTEIRTVSLRVHGMT